MRTGNESMKASLPYYICSVFQWRYTGNLSEYFAKRFHIGITNFYITSLIVLRLVSNAFFADSIFTLGILRSISCFDKPSVKVSSADSKPGGQISIEIFHADFSIYACASFTIHHHAASVL
jgi:hypothetical protein